MKLLRIYTDEAAYFGDRKVFEEIATRAWDAKMAGATVLRALFAQGARWASRESSIRLNGD